MHRFACLAAVAFAASAVAQQVILPIQAVTNGISASANYFNSPTVGSRHQSIYDASHFTSQGVVAPVSINNLEWRPSNGTTTVGRTWSNVQIFVGYSASDYAAPSTTYATNRTGSHTLVYSGAVTAANSAGTSPNNWSINQPLTTPFQYDPTTGQDLLIEIVITGPASPTGGLTLDTTNVVATHRCQAIRSTTSNTATTGALSAFAPCVRIGYAAVPNVASHTPYGAGCYRKTQSFYEVFAGAFPASNNDLSGKTVRLFPNGSGGYDVITSAGATVVPPTTVGLALPDDGPSGALALGFTFPYPGGSTPTVYAHSNGSVTLTGPGVTFMNNATGAVDLLNNAQVTLSPSMQDLLADGAANVQNVFAEPGGAGEYLITWWNMPPFLTVPVANPNLSRFQAALFSDGRVEFRYEALFNESDSNNGTMLVGFSRGIGSIDPGNSDLTAGTISTNVQDVSPLTLSGSPRPVLGQSVTYTLTNVPANAGLSMLLVSFGQSNPGVPLPNLGVAAPGCEAYISVNNVPLSGLLIGAPTVTSPQMWPVGPWAGLQLFAQGFALAPGQNPVGVLSSNGLVIELNVN